MRFIGTSLNDVQQDDIQFVGGVMGAWLSCRLLWLSTGLAVIGSLAAAAGAAETPPNVLFLFADDMRSDSIGALGNPAVKTPHLDALVRRGRSFTNAYCLGGNSPAVCTPSRNMLLSGRAYFRWKDFTPPNGRRGELAPGDGPNFPLSLSAAGYVTYHHGKRGNTAPLIQARFDVNKYLANDEAERRSGEPGQEIVDDAIQFLRERPKDRPFFLYLAFGNPHDPRVAAPAYSQQYQPERLPLPKNFRPLHPFDNGEMTVRDERLSPWPRTADEIRRTLHEYYATITGLDHHIGRLLHALDELELTAQTLVIFSADQGISVGSHGLLGKQNLYDAAMKVPLVFAGPGIVPGVSEALVYLFDVYPTVCDLVGAEVPQDIDGRSFRPLLRGVGDTFREELLLSYRDVQRAYRDARWKVIRYPRVNVTQLFDLQQDPDEIHDLAGDPAQQTRLSQLLERLAALQRQFNDDLPLTVPHPASPAWTPPRE